MLSVRQQDSRRTASGGLAYFTPFTNYATIARMSTVLRFATFALLAFALAACGATPSDPLAIGPMLKRCQEHAERGERPRELVPLPVLPILGCR